MSDTDLKPSVKGWGRPVRPLHGLLGLYQSGWVYISQAESEVPDAGDRLESEEPGAAASLESLAPAD